MFLAQPFIITYEIVAEKVKVLAQPFLKVAVLAQPFLKVAVLAPPFLKVELVILNICQVLIPLALKRLHTCLSLLHFIGLIFCLILR